MNNGSKLSNVCIKLQDECFFVLCHQGLQSVLVASSPQLLKEKKDQRKVLLENDNTIAGYVFHSKIFCRINRQTFQQNSEICRKFAKYVSCRGKEKSGHPLFLCFIKHNSVWVPFPFSSILNRKKSLKVSCREKGKGWIWEKSVHPVFLGLIKPPWGSLGYVTHLQTNSANKAAAWHC